MQSTALCCAYVCFLLHVAPKFSTATMLLQTSSGTSRGSAVHKQKPFLDGDFTRDSSNPLDVYEDMNVTAPGEKAAPATKENAAPKADEKAGKDVAKPAAKDAPKDAAKDAPKDAAKDAGKSAAAMQVALASAAKDVATDGGAPATTAAPSANESATEAVAKTNASAANASASPESQPTNVTEAAVNESQTSKPIPAVAANSSSCVTRNDARASAWWVETAPEGSACVFGADVADEGSHCILSEGQYGSNGWCWTEKDMSAWGSCGDGCPLYGPHAAIGKKLDDVTEVLDKVAEKVDKLAEQGTSKAKTELKK